MITDISRSTKNPLTIWGGQYNAKVCLERKNIDKSFNSFYIFRDLSWSTQTVVFLTSIFHRGMA